MTHRFAGGGQQRGRKCWRHKQVDFQEWWLGEGVSWQLILCTGQGLRGCFLGWYLSGWQSVLAAFCSLKKTQT